MKIALLGDTHWGARNDLPLLYHHMEVFYTWFFDQLKQKNINTIIQLGDLFDRRKYINFRTLQYAQKIFFNCLADNQITLHTLVGNHDTYYRDSLITNSMGLILQNNPFISIYEQPQTLR
jgi:DNA repair exonuclease SbcCD nuclease subunit